MLEPEVVYQAYPTVGTAWRPSILREYLQLKTLQSVYASPAGQHLVFMGGTAIHLLTGSPRFSEDLDFDNRGCSVEEVQQLGDAVTRRFAQEGVRCLSDMRQRGAVTVTLRFPDMLQRWQLSGHRDQVLRIKLDMEPQNWEAPAERRMLARLDVLTPVLATPLPVLLAQKVVAFLGRPRTMGRDIYDMSWLLGMTKPDYAMLNARFGIAGPEELRAAVLAKLGSLDLAALRADVLPFLPSAAEADRITLVAELLRSAAF